MGDVVEIDGFEGEVIGLGLKTTTIRNYRGQIKWIANRGITQVTNFTDGDFLAQVDVNAPYDAKSEEVEYALRQAGQKVTGVVPGATGELQVLGIEFGHVGRKFVLKHLGAFVQVIDFVNQEGEQFDLLAQLVRIVFRKPHGTAPQQTAQRRQFGSVVTAQAAAGDA